MNWHFFGNPRKIGTHENKWNHSIFWALIHVYTRAELKVPHLAEISLSRCDLDLWPTDPKINRCLPYLISNNWYKFHEILSRRSQVIPRKPNLGRTEWRTDGRRDGKPNSIVLRFRRKAGDNKYFLIANSSFCNVNPIA